MLKEGKKRGFVVEVTNLIELFVSTVEADLRKLPYLKGDHLLEVAESLIEVLSTWWL